nr:MAG TPA: hypothetical protein [Caudoviricetes sp.]
MHAASETCPFLAFSSSSFQACRFLLSFTFRRLLLCEVWEAT